MSGDAQNKSDEVWMREALALARAAGERDEPPIGALIVHAERGVIGRSGNCRIEQSDATAHAETLAIREACAAMGDWRLEDCTLYVTLEPCPMCAGAILLARVPRVVYGAANVKFGACETKLRLLDPAIGWNHTVELAGGVLAGECAAVLSDYFSRKRLNKNHEGTM